MGRAHLAIVFYAVLGALAWLWASLRGDASLWTEAPPPWADALLPGVGAKVGASLALGAALAAVTVAATRALVRRTAWARELHAEFRSVLGPLTNREVAVFAATSALGEELFFRGAMLPALGLVLSSCVFGAVHLPPRRALWTWSAWALAMGLCFGGIFLATGQLAGPVLAHGAINFLNLRFICAGDGHADGPAVPTALPRSR